MSNGDYSAWQGSTILTVRKGGEVVIAGDGQVTEGPLILKSNVKKVRRLGDGAVIVGFTGSMADALVLFETLETSVAQHKHQLIRACVEVAKFWRKDPHLCELSAMLVVVSVNHSFLITASGDVLEKEDGIIGVGAGGPYALAAARALYDIEGLSAKEVVEKSMDIAADICVFTNKNIAFESVIEKN